VNYGAFNGLSGAGAATNYAGRGLNPYVYGPDGGTGGDQGGGYTGPTGEVIINYTYGQNDAGPHAVTSRSNGDSFAYDDNGNMTSRTMDSVTWTQVFDAENRLVEVDNGTVETTYVYDAGGNRVKRIVDDGSTVTTTIYVTGMEIELEGSTETQRTIYYSAGGAFRIIGGEDEGLYFRHGDHLGSTSVLSDSTGAKVVGSDVVYAPFGEVRTGELPELTDSGFTGQILDRSSGGLMYYGARYYLPSLKRFISTDTIVPSVLDGQTLNRYTYSIK
jgi:RHS repeat-associated protein